MAIYTQKGGAAVAVSDAELQEMVLSAIEKSGKSIKRMLLLPPDHTRLNSCAGRITEIIYEKYCPAVHLTYFFKDQLVHSKHFYPNFLTNILTFC